ncbi:hypothetical protein L195_g055848, partial [Trifolium pratense]
MASLFHRYSCHDYNNLAVHSMKMVFPVENMIVVGMESLVACHNYLDMVTLEAAEAEGIRQLPVAVEVVVTAAVVEAVMEVVDTLSFVEVEVVEVDMDFHTQHTLCMELGLLLLMKKL